MLLSWTIVFQIKAQPTLGISPSELNIMIDEEFEVDVVTTNYTKMVNSSFSVNWNSNVISLESYEINLSADLFVNDLFVNDGKFALIWNPPTGNCPTFEDGTSILNLKFKALENGSATIEITDMPTVSLAIYKDSTGTPIELPIVIGESGTITVGTNSTTTAGLAQASIKMMQNTPNPFNENTEIPFVLTKSEKINLNILDLNGRSIFQYSNQYGEGTHYIQLEKTVFPQEGVYFFQIKTENTLLTKKMILVR